MKAHQINTVENINITILCGKCRQIVNVTKLSETVRQIETSNSSKDLLSFLQIKENGKEG